MGVPIILDPPTDTYQRGWGPHCIDAEDIICSWTLTTQDANDRPTCLTFDLADDDSPLTIGLNIAQYAITDLISSAPTITIARPSDNEPRVLPMYMSGDSKFNRRVRVLMIAHPNNTPITNSLLGARKQSVIKRPTTTAKRLHRYTHAHPEELIHICKTAGWLTDELRKAIHETSSACYTCAQSGFPLPSKKISLTHVNEAFNQHVQIDFVFPVIRGNKYTVLHMVCTGTAYSETSISPNREASTIVQTLESDWINRHGNMQTLSGDDEFDSKTLSTFLRSREVKFEPRPARRHNKVGIVERKNQTLKRILERTGKEPTTAPVPVILSRATFMSNCFSGSRLLSSFELARGYSPSILGTPRQIISEEILSAHKEQVSIRALQRLLRARAPSPIAPSSIKPGDIILFYYNSSKQNEPDEWREATVTAVKPHHVEVRRSPRGRTSRIAYEDIRLRPNNAITRELMEGTLEDYLDFTDGGEPSTNEHPIEDTIEDDDKELTDNPAQSRALMTKQSLALPSTESDSDTDNITQAARDVGPYANDLIKSSPTDRREITGVKLQSNEQRELETIQENIGAKQVTSREIEFAPSWILQNAVEREHDNNWSGAYIEVPESEVPRKANTISSHTLFKVKAHEEDKLEMKARFVLHGNRDREKDEIRKDSAAADMIIFRMVLSLGLILNFTFGVADIKGAYMQSGPAEREIYVRPPREWTNVRGILWKLLKLPYGIVEAGRQWLKTIEEWMLTKGGLHRVFGVTQLFAKRDRNGKIILLIAKVTDDSLASGPRHVIEEFMDQLQREFTVGKVRIGVNFNFNGCEVEFDESGNITLSMTKYVNRLKPLQIARSRRHTPEDRVTDREKAEYRSLAGTLMYLGTGVIAQAALVTSRMQQRLGDLRVKHLIDANAMLREILLLPPEISFIQPTTISKAILVSLSDAAHGGNEFDYGQTGGICGLRIETAALNDHIFHPFSWTSHKQKRVTYSSFGAEILACADAEDRGFDLKQSLRSLFPHTNIKHEVLIDSRALFDTITTLHECKEFRLRKTVTRIRNAFEAGELDSVQWIQGTKNVADALTKRSLSLSKQLSEMLSTGLWTIKLDNLHHDSEEWK